MPRLTSSVPRYRKHRASGQAVCTIGGKDFYLGPHGTKASRLRYDRLISEWLASDRRLPQQEQDGIAISELIAAFWRFAKKHYVKNGRPTGTADNYKPALSLLRNYYGKTQAADFGPRALKALRQMMIDGRDSRRYINDNVDRLRRVFRWGASEELLPASVYESLRTVESLPKGRSDARETKPIEPVDDDTVDATLPHLPLVVRDMVQFQRLTGARPGEVCSLRPLDVDRSGEIWRYVPGEHKTEHHGRGRVIFVGPRAQEILTPYLLRESTAFCFSPAESERKRKARLRANRKTPVQPSQVDRSKPGAKRRPRNHYTSNAYIHAIQRACDKAFPPEQDLEGDALNEWQKNHRWSPNRVRHTAGTEIRKQFGLEGAQVVLGHSKADVTQVYAERDWARAEDIMRQVG